MGNFKAFTQIVLIIVIFIVIIGGVTYYQIPLGTKDLPTIYSERPAEIQLITTISSLVAIVVGGFATYAFSVIKDKNDILEKLNLRIIEILEKNAITNNVLMEKINRNTENDLRREKQLSHMSDILEDHHQRLKRLEES